MATSKIIAIIPGTSKATSTDFSIAKITEDVWNTKISNIDVNTKSVKNTDYGIAKITDSVHMSTISQTLPFRVKFTTVGIEGFVVPPIGIAVIGFNNYIL